MRAIGFIVGLLACAGLSAGEPLEAERGLASHVDVDYGPALRAKATQKPTSPVLVRVFDVEPEGRQRIEFIGTVAGAYDLREFVEREDGRVLADDLAAMPIVVVSRLPSGHTPDLYGAPEGLSTWRIHYRALLWTGAGIWGAIPVVLLVVRAIRRPAPDPPTPPAPALTMSDEIRALIEAGRSRELSVDERGRLELMVMRLLMEDAPASDGDHVARLVRTLRDRPETRGLVTAIETWLHARDASPGAHERASRALEAFRSSRLAVGAASASEAGA